MCHTALGVGFKEVILVVDLEGFLFVSSGGSGVIRVTNSTLQIFLSLIGFRCRSEEG